MTLRGEGPILALMNTAQTQRSDTPRRPGWWVLLILSGAIGGCSSAPATPDFQLERQPWSFRGSEGVHLITDHFDIYTTADDQKLVDYLPAYLETMHAHYASVAPPPGDSTKRLQTYLFVNERQWMAFTKQRFPGRNEFLTSVQVGGFSVKDMCVMRYIRPAAYTLAVIAHEGLHQYLGAHFSPRIPAWLNEGLACYHEAFDVRPSGPVLQPLNNTFRLNGLRETLAGDGLLPFTELLAKHPGEVIIQSRSVVTRAYYAQAWALVAYLRHGARGRYAERFETLMADYARGVMATRAGAAQATAPDPAKVSFGEAVFRAYITDDLPAFEEDLYEFMERLAFP